MTSTCYYTISIGSQTHTLILVCVLVFSWILHVPRKKMYKWVERKGGISVFYSLLLP